jgi:hypothetical protein
MLMALVGIGEGKTLRSAVSGEEWARQTGHR